MAVTHLAALRAARACFRCAPYCGPTLPLYAVPAPGSVSAAGASRRAAAAQVGVAAAVAARRRCGGVAAPGGGSESRQYVQQGKDWVTTPERWVEFRFSDNDLARMREERAAFRAEARLTRESLPASEGAETLGALATIRGLSSVVRLTDLVSEPFMNLCVNRLVKNAKLVEHFGIPVLDDTDSEKPLHSKAVPGEGVYTRVRMQAYWLALHVWLIHSKQFLVQENEGLFGSALCALITRRLFEWQWNQFRGWMHDADVPAMSLTSEVQDMQEYIFGLCVALDDAFREEAPDGTLAACQVAEADLREGRYGLGPSVKHVLWANIYSGSEPRDSKRLYDLTVYLLRQRAALEGVPRGAFFAGEFEWADYKL